MQIRDGDDRWSSTAAAVGKPLSMEKDELVVHVKAMTLHRFQVERTGWGPDSYTHLHPWVSDAGRRETIVGCEALKANNIIAQGNALGEGLLR